MGCGAKPHRTKRISVKEMVCGCGVSSSHGDKLGFKVGYAVWNEVGDEAGNSVGSRSR